VLVVRQQHRLRLTVHRHALEARDASDTEGLDQAPEREGWIRERGGSHQVKMTKTGTRPITLSENKRRAYSKGFEAELHRQAGLKR
jgi:hypothetical protein